MTKKVVNKKKKVKENSSDNQFHNILDFSMFYQVLVSPQMKWCPVITYKHGLYEVSHELPKDLRL